MTFETFLNITPHGKGRPRFGKGFTYTDKKTVAKETEIRWLLQKEKPVRFDGPICLDVRFYFLKPKSAPKKRQHHTVRPDLDNLLKLVSDACNGILWKDDAQICEIYIWKLYSEREGINIRVTEINNA